MDNQSADLEELYRKQAEAHRKNIEEWEKQHEAEVTMLAEWRKVIDRLNAALDRLEAADGHRD